MSENSKNWGVNIERENLHIFWTTWGTSMKFSGKTWLNIKTHKKKQGFTLSLEYTNLEQVTTTVKIWSERNLSKISDFSILGTGQSFCLSSFFSFLNIKLQQLSKLEVRERFPRYPSFLFWVQGKTEDSGTSKILYFYSKSISWPLSFYLNWFVVVFAT